MSRPLPTTFEKDQQSPMTPISASSSNNAISYKANVNRQKTKKWADAKPASYGGDDWGDDDEYDDMPPPPVSKPTGFRQQGQAIHAGAKPESPIVEAKKNYGDLPALPRAGEDIPFRARANSFDADDETRNFSSGTMRKPTPSAAPAPSPATQAPATRFSQITGPSSPPALSITTQLPAPPAATGLRKVSAVSPTSNSPHPDVLLPGRSTSNESSQVVSPISAVRTPSVDYQARRDYSPSAVPPPLHTRASPGPQGASNSPATARFPARKSSLSQSIGPDPSEFIQQPQEVNITKSRNVEHSSASSVTPRSPSSQGKALPFIRPSDIYKRAEEERKERESMESGRPSMDSVVGTRSTDRSYDRSTERSQSPTNRQLREKSSSDSLGVTGRRRTSTDGDDMSDSLRLRPTLEPVRERKSEYGFEGFNASDHAPLVPSTGNEPKPSGNEGLDVEKDRQQSTSPKLPDLNRLSGFGADLFAPPKSEIPISSASKDLDAPEDHSLHKQESMGFTSVVNQAFDREDTLSIPNTPASQTNSDIKRTDSESTGTTGISPIMSRVPSTAAEARSRDVQPPTILEVVNETSPPTVKDPNIVHQADEDSTPIQPLFKPGHRRDISTPSPNNSPARTPDLAKSTVVPSQEALVSDPSPASSIDDDDRSELQPPRPIAEREQSFRPNLPGGWTSYANTERSETSRDGSREVSESSEHNRTPIAQSSSIPATDNLDASELTPTGAKHLLPESNVQAVIPDTSADSDSDSENEWDDSPVHTPRVEASAGPGGAHNQKNVPVLDPQNIPKLESTPPETQLRPDTINRGISAISSIGPTPPAKDTPKESIEQSSDYFQKTEIPSIQKHLHEPEASESLDLSSNYQGVPTFTTDSHPEDEENDKLHQEIIRSLSPQLSGANSRDESLLSDQVDDQSSSNPARISSYLPSEYDNYWASTAEEEQPAAVVTAPAASKLEQPSHLVAPASIIVSSPSNPEVNRELEPENNQEVEPVPPLSPRGEQLLGAPRPPMHPQRFSWEASSEDVSELPTQVEPHNQTTEHNQPREQTLLEEKNESDVNTTELEAPEVINPLRSNPTTPVHPPDHTSRDAALMAGGAAVAGVGAAAAYHGSQPQGQSDRRLSLAEEKDPQSSAYPVSPSPPEHEHPSRISGTHLASNTEPQSDRSPPSAPFIPSADSVSTLHTPLQSRISPITSPARNQFQRTNQVPRVTSFKDLAAMKTSEQRVQRCDEMRSDFAALDYGLHDWIQTMKAQHPEHADVGPVFAATDPSFQMGGTRGKFSKQAIGNQPPLQQPYYQQYLNASSPTTPGTPVTRPGPTVPVGSQHGLSASGTKITTQQVQAKGKELLHTAGIFGGKAGKAGKGLLAKGKNKLRAAGANGDKNTSSPVPTTNPSTPSPSKQDRRSSWGLRRLEKEKEKEKDIAAIANTNATPPRERQRAATLEIDTKGPPVLGPYTADGIMSAPVLGEDVEGREPLESGVREGGVHEGGVRGVESEDEAVAQQNGGLNVPAPIGKAQPSWDPFNATPIAEEEGFGWGEHAQHSQAQFQTHTREPVAAPASTRSEETSRISSELRAASKGLMKRAPLSERSDSGDVFHDAKEDSGDHGVARVSEDLTSPPTAAPDVPSDLGDWVIVPKDVEPVDSNVKKVEDTHNSEDFRKDEDVEDEPRVEETIPAHDDPLPKQVEESVLLQTKLQPEQQVGDVIPSNVEPQVEPQVENEAPARPLSLQQESQTTLAIPPPTMADLRSGSYEIAQAPDNSTLNVTTRPRTNTSTSILDRPRYSYDVLRAEEPAQSVLQQPTQPEPQLTQIPSQPKSVAPEYQPPPVDTSFQNIKAPQLEDEPKSTTSFKGLPPIRRTSTFGLGFGSRQAKKRFPIEDEDEVTPKVPQLPFTAPEGEASLASQPSAPVNQDPYQQAGIPPPEPPFPERPAFQFSEQSQRAVGPSHTPQLYNAPKARDPPFDNIRRSQEAWRPNQMTPVVQPPPQAAAPANWSEASQRKSFEKQSRPSIERQQSRTPSFSREPEILNNEYAGRAVLNQQQNRSYETPPSSAQRYPDLFRPGQTATDIVASVGNSDLPSHYYQAPITRDVAFLPRQQTSEYQISGIGPPADEPRPRSRSNSQILRDLGNRIRSVSRDRNNSVSQDGAMQSPGKYEGTEYAPSSIASEETEGRKKRRNSIFGMNRASSNNLAPQSRDSMVAHHPGSRTDLLLSGQSSQITSPQDRKRSFFGSSPSEKSKPNKLSRASTSGMLSDEPGKKKRFSGLSSMFNRSSKDATSSKGSVVSDRPQATRELSQNERLPLESPAPAQQRQFSMPPPPKPTQQRSFLTKLSSSGGDQSQPRQESKTRSGLLGGIIGNESSQPRDDSRKRKSSTSTGLLGGFMNRRSQQPEKREDSSSQGSRSQGSRPQYHPNQVPPAQTYSDIQENPTPTQPSIPAWQPQSIRPVQPEPSRQKLQFPTQIQQQYPPYMQQPPQQQQQQHVIQPELERERGRRQDREPRYDSVPIPGGYSLVRGDGAVPVATEYDPRGLNRLQQNGPQFTQAYQGVQQNPYPSGPSQINTQQQPISNPPSAIQHRSLDKSPPNLAVADGFENYQRATRRISREDVLARSPARKPADQQRPYQLSLPDDPDDRETRTSPYEREMPVISPPSSIRTPSSIQTTPSRGPPQNHAIQRLAQPVLRHPQSPAGYPLPDDSVFSPINPSASQFPPPPPPKWPAHMDNIDHHHLNLTPDLGRSNTRLTAVSQLTQPGDMLAPMDALDKETGGREITPSPTPPTPAITPPPLHPSHVQLQLHRDSLVRGANDENQQPSPGLYDASPRLPPQVANDLRLQTRDQSQPQFQGHGGESSSGVIDERERARRVASAQEEKIFYDKDRLGVEEEEEETVPAAMSATSYPGQEWNPYAGVYEDEY